MPPRNRRSQTLSTEEPASLPDEVNRLYREFVQKQRPPLTRERLDEILPPQGRIHAQWTADDEAQLLADYQDSAARRDIDGITNISSILSLWKACSQLLHCSPMAIISPINGLEYTPYQGAIAQSLGDTMLDHGVGPWSVGFNTTMARIIAHPTFLSGRPDVYIRELVSFLQFATMCRSGF